MGKEEDEKGKMVSRRKDMNMKRRKRLWRIKEEKMRGELRGTAGEGGKKEGDGKDEGEEEEGNNEKE